MVPTPPPPRSRNTSSGTTSTSSGYRTFTPKPSIVVDIRKVPLANLDWFNYCNYLADCVNAESQIEPPSVNDKRRFRPLVDVANEPVSSKIELNEDDKIYLEKVETGRSVILGWPIICIDGKEGNRIVPIFQAEIDIAASLESGKFELTNSEWRTSDLMSATSQIESSDIELLQELIDSLKTEKTGARAKKMKIGLGEVFPNWKKDYRVEIAKLSVGELSNQTIILIGAETQFSQSLVQELKEISMRSDWRPTAAGQLFEERVLLPKDAPEIVAPLVLNESQEAAIAKLSSHLVTVVTGPPGTGKSQLISALVAQSWLVNHSLLVTSVNNAAVDVAVERIKTLDPALLLRTGKKSVREALSSELETFVERAGSIKVTARDAGREVDQTRRLFISSYQNRRGRMKAFRGYLHSQSTLSQVSEDLISLNYRLWGCGSTPIAKRFRILRFLSNVLLKEEGVKNFKTKFSLKYMMKHFALIEFNNSELQEWLRLRKLFINQRRCLERSSQNAITESQMKSLDESWQEDSKNLLTALVRATLQKNTSSLASLRTAVLKGQYQAAISTSNLRLFPAWAVTAYSAATTIPLMANHLDLVVVDEASQCSIAATLPLAYRAKQLMILGDLNQLRPIVKLGEPEERLFAEKWGLEVDALRAKRMDHRTSSIFAAFDNAVNDDAKVLLDEHYRSHSSISHWFNANFYAGNLTLLGSRPTTGIEQGIRWIDIYGNWQRGDRGSYLNRAECQEVIEIVKKYSELNLSIGVVTPYARQAQEIRELLSKELTEEQIHHLEFVSSTAHRFQGGEKDLIVYSTVITPQTPQRSADWIKKNRELINVAVSRAREALIVVGHPDAPTALGIGDLVSLRKASLMTMEDAHGEDLVQTAAEKALYEGFQKNGIIAAPQLPISGVIVDFAIPLSDYKGLAIEVDGEVHEDMNGIRVRQDFQRDRMLKDLGWKVMRVPNWRVFGELEQVISEVISCMQPIDGGEEVR
jgi:very-short-patch-repair endonuclease